MTEKNIDILIPVATKSPYLEEALNSASQQTAHCNVYIIENNVGNREYSLELEHLADKYNAFYVMFKDRLPMFENWNRSLTVGDAEWAAFLHDDDKLSPNYVRTILDNAEKADIIFTEYRYFSSLNSEAPKNDTGLGQSTATIIERREETLGYILTNMVHISSTAFRRKIEISFPSEYKFMGDQAAVRFAVANNKNIRIGEIRTDTPTMIRKHPQQATHGVSRFGSLEMSNSIEKSMDIVSEEDLNLGVLAGAIQKNLPGQIIPRFAAAVLRSKNSHIKFRLAGRLLCHRCDPRLVVELFARVLFEKLIWKIKI